MKPQVVTLCGSTRFRPDFDRVAAELTMAGCIVLMPNVWLNDGHDAKRHLPPVTNAAVKEALDELHLRKIDLADVVMVINLNGYVGKSTTGEISYARAHGKQVVYAYPTEVPS